MGEDWAHVSRRGRGWRLTETGATPAGCGYSERAVPDETGRFEALPYQGPLDAFAAGAAPPEQPASASAWSSPSSRG